MDSQLLNSLETQWQDFSTTRMLDQLLCLEKDFSSTILHLRYNEALIEKKFQIKLTLISNDSNVENFDQFSSVQKITEFVSQNVGKKALRCTVRTQV